MAITYLSGERIQGLGGSDIAATSTTDYVNDPQAGSLHNDSIGAYKDYIGVQVLTGHPAVGKTFSSFTFWAWSDQSPDGQIGLRIVHPPASGDTLGTVKGTSVTTVESNTIPNTPTSGTSMTFAAPLDGNGDAIPLLNEDIVTLYDVEDTINTPDGGQIQPVMGDDAISYQQKMAWYSGGGSAGWATYSTKSVRWKGTRITALIPAVNEKAAITNVPVGTRFEETDNRKIFRRKGAVISLDDLKAYYSCDETTGDVINKASAYGSTDAIANFDLSVTGATQNVTGKIDKAISFTGNNNAQADDSNLTDTAFISNTGAIWTICLWVKLDSRVGDQAWVTTTDFGSGENGIMFRIMNSSGHIYLKFGTGGGTVIGGTATTQVIPDTNWNFVVGQYDYNNGAVKVSVNNGSFETVATTVISDTTTPANKLVVGNTPQLDNDLNGDTDEISIWNRILTAAEITTLYNSGTGKNPAPSWVEKGTA
jgi:hypothetical protein